MKLEFESIEEVKDFVTKLKGTRGGKADKDEAEGQTGHINAPSPLQPPQGSATGFSAFAPPAQAAAPAATGFPAAGAPQPAPEVVALALRIGNRTDAVIAQGQNAEQAVGWLRSQCATAGLDASAATLNDIKAVFLPKMPPAALENIAKLIGA